MLDEKLATQFCNGIQGLVDECNLSSVQLRRDASFPVYFILKRALNFPLVLWNVTKRRHKIPLRIYVCAITAGAVVGSHELFHIEYWTSESNFSGRCSLFEDLVSTI